MLSVCGMGEPVGLLVGEPVGAQLVICIGEAVGALSWLYGRVSRCSRLAVWESHYVLAVGCMGEPVGAPGWLYRRANRCSRLIVWESQ